jgi:flagellar hook-length control protein FliK
MASERMQSQRFADQLESANASQRGREGRTPEANARESEPRSPEPARDNPATARSSSRMTNRSAQRSVRETNGTGADELAQVNKPAKGTPTSEQANSLSNAGNATAGAHVAQESRADSALSSRDTTTQPEASESSNPASPAKSKGPQSAAPTERQEGTAPDASVLGKAGAQKPRNDGSKAIAKASVPGLPPAISNDTNLRAIENGAHLANEKAALAISTGSKTSFNTELASTLQMLDTQRANTSTFLNNTGSTITLAATGLLSSDTASLSNQTLSSLVGAMNAGPAPGMLEPSNSGTLPATITVTAPVFSEQFPGALASELRFAIQGGIERASITLNPEALGPIQVELKIEGTEASVQFRALNSETRDAVSATQEVLRALLADQGLSLQQFDVGQQSTAFAQHFGNDEQRAGSRSNSSGVRSEAQSPGDPTIDAASPAFRRHGLVNLVA